jgi:hypothetical protein
VGRNILALDMLYVTAAYLWSRALLEKLIIAQLIKKFLTFYAA